MLEMMSDEVRTRRFVSLFGWKCKTRCLNTKDCLMKSLELRSFDVTSVPHAAPLGFGVLDSIDVSFEMDDALVFDCPGERTRDWLYRRPFLVGFRGGRDEQT